MAERMAAWDGLCFRLVTESAFTGFEVSGLLPMVILPELSFTINESFFCAAANSGKVNAKVMKSKTFVMRTNLSWLLHQSDPKFYSVPGSNSIRSRSDHGHSCCD